MTYDDPFIVEPHPAFIDTSCALSEVKDLISYGFAKDNEIDLMLLNEFIFFTHIWAASANKKPGIREVINTMPVLWIRLHSDALRRWFQFVLCKLVANPLVVPQGCSCKQYNEELGFQCGTTIIDGIGRYDRGLIKNLVYQANDEMNDQNGLKKNLGATFNPRIVIDTNPPPFAAQDHIVDIALTRYTFEQISDAHKMANAKTHVEEACIKFLHDMLFERIASDNPAIPFLKITYIFEKLTEVFSDCHVLNNQRVADIMAHCRKIEFQHHNINYYDPRHETLYLSSIWISANAHRFQDRFFPLYEIADFISSQRKWSKIIDERLLSRLLGEEHLILNRDRRDERLKKDMDPDNTSAQVGSEGSPGSETCEVTEDETLTTRKKHEGIPFPERRNQVTYVEIDILQLQKLTQDVF